MYRPLYWFGNGAKAEINYTLSVGKAPVFSNNDQTVTIHLNHYMWSDGEQVTAQDVIFWMNLIKANKTSWAAYVPGAFPDNVVSYSAPNSTTVVLKLNKSYNPTWFTYNELSQITPLPLAWDRTSLSAPAPNTSTPVSSLPDGTTAGATAVYNFLNTQSGQLSTYATSPIWSVVDGPFKLQSFTTQGRAVFVPNAQYTGPVKPKISKFVELPFTSEATEFNVLRSGGQINYGYIPYSDIAQKGYITSKGYSFDPWTLFSFDYFVVNFNNPTLGPVFHQLYFRQAFQHLVDQEAWIKSFAHGLGTPTYSPVPTQPANPFVDAKSKANNYPYSTATAKSLLTSHGWKIENGTLTCATAGSGAKACGAGIAAGTQVNINLQYASGVTVVAQEMQALKSAASQVGININLSTGTFNQVISNAAPCSATSASCTWQMENWGAGWVYAPDYLPTGGELYQTGAGSNFGSYSDPKSDNLIQLTHTAPQSQFQSAMNQYQDYMVEQLPVVFTPNLYFQLSEVSSNLKGVVGQQSAYANLTPEYWYYTK
jgi:peptide/nickel transport system substrate-binding protein